MRLCVGRRLIALLIALLLSVGVVAHGAVAADMGAKMLTAAVVEMPMSQDCDACGDEGMPEAICYGVCNSSVAVLPHLVPARVIALGQSNSPLAPAQTSWRAAPDPSPPKPVVLS